MRSPNARVKTSNRDCSKYDAKMEVEQSWDSLLTVTAFVKHCDQVYTVDDEIYTTTFTHSGSISSLPIALQYPTAFAHLTKAYIARPSRCDEHAYQRIYYIMAPLLWPRSAPPGDAQVWRSPNGGIFACHACVQCCEVNGFKEQKYHTLVPNYMLCLNLACVTAVLFNLHDVTRWRGRHILRITPA